MKCNFCEKNIDTKLSFKNIFVSKKEQYCSSCQEKLSLKIYKHNNHHLYYLADYDFLKELIYSIKYFSNIKEAKRFKIAFNDFFKKNKFDLILIAPSNKTREVIRGFNHIKVIADICGVNYLDIFSEAYRPKQSKISGQRKLHKIFIKDNYIPKIRESSKILIIDDIFTSGKTLESLANSLLEVKKELEIHFFCLAKS